MANSEMMWDLHHIIKYIVKYKHLLAVAALVTWSTMRLWMANFAMMWESSRWPWYLVAGSTQFLLSRQGHANVIRRRSLLPCFLGVKYRKCNNFSIRSDFEKIIKVTYLCKTSPILIIFFFFYPLTLSQFMFF